MRNFEMWCIVFKVRIISKLIFFKIKELFQPRTSKSEIQTEMLAGSRQFLRYAAFVVLSRQGRRAYTSVLTALADRDLLMTCLIADRDL